MPPRPQEVKLHSKSQCLELVYAESGSFNLPSEYLRVYSPSVEVRGLGELQTDKQDVAIERLEPVGNYALRLFFSDGHKSGVYSWEHLYELATQYEQRWQDYLERLDQAGHHRRQPD